MDYKDALIHSPQPHKTLQQAFAATTGRVVGPREIQKLLKTYSEEEVLDSILKMEDKEIKKPYPYMVGILRNTRAKRLAVNNRNGRDAVASAVDMLQEESKRENRPQLRSPFNNVTTE